MVVQPEVTPNPAVERTLNVGRRNPIGRQHSHLMEQVNERVCRSTNKVGMAKSGENYVMLSTTNMPATLKRLAIVEDA